MTSEFVVHFHFYLPDATRTACGLPIRGVKLISRFYDQTECQACIATDSWEEAAAAAMERALHNPWTKQLEAQKDWLKAFEEPENALFSKYLLKKLEAFKTTPPSNAFIPIGFDACKGLAPNEFHAQLFGKYEVPYVRFEIPSKDPTK